MQNRRLTISEERLVYGLMDTFRNTGEFRQFVESFKRTLNENDIFSIKLRHSKDDGQHEAVKLRQLPIEHSMSEIIWGHYYKVCVPRVPVRWRTKCSLLGQCWQARRTSQIVNLVLWFTMDATGLDRSILYALLPSDNVDCYWRALQFTARLLPATRNSKMPIVDCSLTDGFPNCCVIFCWFHVFYDMERHCNLPHELQQYDEQHIFRWLRHLVFAPTKLGFCRFWSADVRSVCRQDTNETTTWLQFSQCKRWTHAKCVGFNNQPTCICMLCLTKWYGICEWNNGPYGATKYWLPVHVTKTDFSIVFFQVRDWGSARLT